MKKLLTTTLVSSVLFASAAQGELVRNGIWEIKSGDTLDNVLKNALPDEPLRQKRLKRLLPILNKSAFDGKKLITGKNLRLPGVRMPNDNNASTSNAGRVLIASGTTTAKSADGKIRTLKRGSSILSGDTIETNNARAQIRFNDGSLLALRPNTEFKIEEFNYNNANQKQSRSIYNLVKGGFRTISGTIGKYNRENYKVKTAVATIGIRGTHYGVTLCQEGSCGDKKDGLYGGVVDGSISTTNDAGTSVFNNDEYFSIAGLNQLAEKLLAPPGVIFDSDKQTNISTEKPNEDEAEKSKLTDFTGIETTEQLFDGTIDNPFIREELKKVFDRDDVELADSGTIVGLSFAGSIPENLTSTSQDSSAAARIRQGDNGTFIAVKEGDRNAFDGAAFIKEVDGGSLAAVASINPSSGTLTDTGNDSALGLHWGRWSNTKTTLSAGTSSAGKIKESGGNSAIPETGIIFALAQSDKAIKNMSELNTAFSDLGLDNVSTPATMHIGGVAPVDLNGQSASASTSSLTLDILGGSLFYTLNAEFNSGEEYNVSVSDTLANAAAGKTLTATGSCSTGGACLDGTVNSTMNGDASVVFTRDGNNYLGTSVNYSIADRSTTTNSPVGIAGVDIFKTQGFASGGGL